VSQRKYSVEQAGQQIDRFLGPVLKAAGLQLRFAAVEGETRHPDFENPEVVVKFSGADVDMLLENKAELLLALEQLTLEVMRVPAEDHSLVCFDANDYRMLRIEELRLSALAAADRVKKTGVPFPFNPMNSRERRIVHLALRNDPAVRSESAGLGPHRQVVIYPAGMASQPELAQAAAAPRSAPPGRGAPQRRRRR
jgi:spoIIIJ-associated protein